MFKKLYEGFVEGGVKLITKVKWKQRHELPEADKQRIRELLTKDYYIITTRRGYFLSTFFISLSHFVLTGRWGHYSHVLMNLEDEVRSDADFRLVEATTRGTKYSTFDEVFSNVDAVRLLKPRHMDIGKWTEVFDAADSYIGTPYDNLFDLKTDTRMSCVELVRALLKRLPTYRVDFHNFELMIFHYGNLTPQMFVECDDFETVLEIRR
jgi:hypothetical protein